MAVERAPIIRFSTNRAAEVMQRVAQRVAKPDWALVGRAIYSVLRENPDGALENQVAEVLERVGAPE